MNTPNIEHLREQVTQLKALLDDPHPGTSSWVEAYGRRMGALMDFWQGETRLYLVIAREGVEPVVLGPYEKDAERRTAVFWNANLKDAAFRLDIAKGVPVMTPFSNEEIPQL